MPDAGESRNEPIERRLSFTASGPLEKINKIRGCIQAIYVGLVNTVAQMPVSTSEISSIIWC